MKHTTTFHEYIKEYQVKAGSHAQGSIVSYIDQCIGSIQIELKQPCFALVESGFEKLLESVKERGLSESTVQSYIRYFKAICNNGEKLKLSSKLPRITRENNPASSFEVGKSIERIRPISPVERSKYFEAIKRTPKLAWFYPVAEFARTMPIRPQDMCELTINDISEIHSQIKYAPMKTAGRSSVKFAYPAILPHMKEFILSRVKDTECPFVFFRTGYTKNGEDQAKHYKLSYEALNYAHDTICKLSGIANLQFYDWRHDAVNFLISAGFDDSTIMKFAGWSSTAMIRRYDTNDRERLSSVTKDILSNGNKSILKEVV
jgi:integrase